MTVTTLDLALMLTMRALQASVVLLSVLFCYCQCYCLLLLLLVLLLKCQKMLYLCSCLAHKFAPNCERREFLKQTQLTVAPKFVSISLETSLEEIWNFG